MPSEPAGRGGRVRAALVGSGLGGPVGAAVAMPSVAASSGGSSSSSPARRFGFAAVIDPSAATRRDACCPHFRHGTRNRPGFNRPAANRIARPQCGHAAAGAASGGNVLSIGSSSSEAPLAETGEGYINAAAAATFRSVRPLASPRQCGFNAASPA